MTTDSSRPASLPTEKKRQAAEVMAAFEYQVLHTVLAWLVLNEGEVLIVEGSEDFDLLSEESAEAIQVKHSEAGISLGQKKVIQSLNQFWVTISKDPREVSCTFLSSSGVVSERDSPFDGNRSCLARWQAGLLSDQEIDTLSAYLCGKNNLSDELKQFLIAEPVEKRREQFFDRIRWRFHSGNAETVESIIFDKLAKFNGPYRIERASALKKVLRALKDEVWLSLRISGDRLLDFRRLTEIWEREVAVHFSEAELQALVSTASVGKRKVEVESSAISEIPPLPSLCLKRESLTADLLRLLTENSALFIHGSSKMGKTTLTKCVATSSRLECRWWSGAGKSGDEVKIELEALSRELETHPNQLLVVLDNLDLSASSYSKLEPALLTILELLRHGSSRLLINGEFSLCPQAQQGLGLTQDARIEVPRLLPEEIEPLLQLFGCPFEEAQRKSVATYLWAKSTGHPLLSVIHVSHLRDQNWPSESLHEPGSGHVLPELQDVHQLIGGLEESQIELLERLSLFPGIFRQDHAKKAGELSPGVNRPGSIFTRLIGPWVEPVAKPFYQLTPLLADLAKADQTDKWCQKFRKQILGIFLSTPPVTVDEAAEAFQIAWEDKNEGALTAFAMEVMQQEEMAHANFGKRVLWFLSQKLTNGELLYPENPTLSLLFRPIQFQFAEHVWPRLIPLIVRAWKAEIDQFPYADSVDDHRRMYLVRTLSYDGTILSPSELVDHLRQLRSLGMPPEFEGQTLRSMDGRGAIDSVSFMALQRGTEFQYLEKLIDALDELDQETRKSILKNTLRDPFDVNLMINRVWLHESDKESPNWQELVSSFHRCLAVVSRWEHPVIVGAFFRGICLVLEEYLNDHGEIASLLAKAEQEELVPREVIIDCKSSHMSACGEFEGISALCEEALEILPKPSNSFDTERAMQIRRAAIAEGKLERWSEAAKWFGQIPANLLEPHERPLAAGSHAERAFCYWKDGDYDSCLTAMIDALKASEALSSHQNEQVAFVTRKLITHMVSWICGEGTVAFQHDLATPVLGAATSGEVPDGFLELPPPDESNAWPLLTRFEKQCGDGSRAFEEAAKSITSSQNAGARFLLTAEGINRMLASGDVGDMPAQVIALAEAKNEAMSAAPLELRSPHRDDPREFTPDDAVPCLAALVGLKREGNEYGLESLLGDWRSSLGEDPHESWSDWLNSIETILAMEIREALPQKRNETDWARQMLFLWNFICSANASKAVQIQSQYFWLCEIRRQPFHDKVDVPFCSVAETSWLELVDSPGLLHSPALYLPEVKRLLSNSPSNYRTLAEILRAGAPLLGLNLDMGELSFLLN